LTEEIKLREIVLPGQEIPLKGLRPGQGVVVEKGRAYSMYLGVKSVKDGVVSVTPLGGRYLPKLGDKVVGKIMDIGPTYWLVDINAPYVAPLHVNDVPWRVKEGELQRYLDIGDLVYVKVSRVSEVGQTWVTMKERGLRPLRGGFLIHVVPTKVPRIIGKGASMIKLIQEGTKCKIVVGMNGRIWIDCDPEKTMLVIRVIRMIEREAHTLGLTERVKKMLGMGVGEVGGDKANG